MQVSEVLIYRLITNMRAGNDTWFADYLLRVGNGTEEADDQGNILLPDDICLPSTGEVDDLEKLIDHLLVNIHRTRVAGEWCGGRVKMARWLRARRRALRCGGCGGLRGRELASEWTGEMSGGERD